MEVGMVVSDITSSISTLSTHQTAEKQTAIHTYVCTYDKGHTANYTTASQNKHSLTSNVTPHGQL